jgi:hypothetical protein
MLKGLLEEQLEVHGNESASIPQPLCQLAALQHEWQAFCCIGATAAPCGVNRA